MTNQTPEQIDSLDSGDRERLGLRVGTATLLRSWRTAGIAIPFLILFVALSISSSPFLHTTNLINILDQQASTLCIAAAGTLVLVAGGIDLSVGATYGLATVVAGEICTLAMSFVIGGLALKVSGGNLIVLSANSGFYRFANAQFLTVPSAVWMTLLFVVVLGLLLSRTTFGRYMVASGGNAEAARLAGVRVNRIRVITFTLSGGAAALGGVIDISRLLSAQAASGGSALAFTVLAGIVVGGTSIAGGEGSVWRTGIGVLFIALIGNGSNLLGINPLYQQIVLGIILLIAVGLDSWARQRRL